MSQPTTATLTEEAPLSTSNDPPLVHLVLRADWPIALCGANVRDHLGESAPGRDRCVDCLRISRSRGLGRPGWASQ
jgi:hypothetical protein